MNSKSIKALIITELCYLGVDFINPIRKNEPHRRPIALKATTDVIVSQRLKIR